MAKYRLIQLDVWGNAKDGWEINDRMPLNVVFDIDMESHKDFRKLIKEILTDVFNAGYLTTNDARKLTVDFSWSDGNYIEICHKKEAYKPLFGLEVIDESLTCPYHPLTYREIRDARQSWEFMQNRSYNNQFTGMSFADYMETFYGYERIGGLWCYMDKAEE